MSLTGDIKGLAIGDFIQFGGLKADSPSIDVTAFVVDTKKNELTITYNDATQTGLHAAYHLQAMQPNTTFSLDEHQTFPGGHNFSTLTVVAAKTVGSHAAAASDDSVHVVGIPITDHAVLAFGG